MATRIPGLEPDDQTQVPTQDGSSPGFLQSLASNPLFQAAVPLAGPAAAAFTAAQQPGALQSALVGPLGASMLNPTPEPQAKAPSPYVHVNPPDSVDPKALVAKYGAPPPQLPPQMQGGPQMPQMPATPGMAMPKDQTGAILGQIQQGVSDQQKGAQEEADARGQQALARASALENQAQQAQQFAQQQQSANDAAFKETQAKQGEIQKQLQDLAQQKKDPAHWWNSRSGLQKASAALGLVFSNIGAALTGQPALNLIHDAINRDMDAQQANIDNKRAILGQQANLVEQNYQRFGNLQQARMATMGMQLQALAQQGEAAAMKFENPAQKAHALQMTGQLQAQGAQMLDQVFQQQHQQAYQNNMLKLEAAKFGLQKQELATQLGMKAMANGAKSIDRLVPGPDGQLREAYTPEDAKAVKEKQAAFGQYQQNLKAYQDLVQIDPIAVRDPTSPAGQKAEALRHEIASAKASFEAGKDSPARAALLDKFEGELPGGSLYDKAVGLLGNNNPILPGSWLASMLGMGARDKATLDTMSRSAMGDLASAYGSHVVGGAPESLDASKKDRDRKELFDKYGGK